MYTTDCSFKTQEQIINIRSRAAKKKKEEKNTKWDVIGIVKPKYHPGSMNHLITGVTEASVGLSHLTESEVTLPFASRPCSATNAWIITRKFIYVAFTGAHTSEVPHKKTNVVYY